MKKVFSVGAKLPVLSERWEERPFSAATKAGPTTKPSVLSQSSQYWRPAGKTVFRAVAWLPVLSQSCECGRKAPVPAQSCEESLRWCHKGPSRRWTKATVEPRELCTANLSRLCRFFTLQLRKSPNYHRIIGTGRLHYHERHPSQKERHGPC